ncbi:hypothetical protein [Chryseoglobus sp. 28M-23]|uniref:hypothetical protein n=1 Tax=Chryseoglobus sp. 28M-23 TaxID=2772253 RepID=UPI001745F458|nr:hypothetical protein [Chryseoglobus sp. 28M-23]QOD94066.1 hypothetical protein IE160_02210 [Chryseoglobus sp. 28M-23]
MTPTIITPDQTDKARQIITLMIALDPEAQGHTLARLVAATLHGGPGTALERFASSGTLESEAALAELNELRVPLEQEDWIDTLGRYILLNAGARS